jgi:carbon storage regulator CsrA
MLILSRKVGERIHIGEEITIIINRLAGNRVTLGIEAPDHLRIMRGELPVTPPVENAALPPNTPKKLETMSVDIQKDASIIRGVCG